MEKEKYQIQVISATCALNIEVILIFDIKQLFPRQINLLLKRPKSVWLEAGQR